MNGMLIVSKYVVWDWQEMRARKFTPFSSDELKPSPVGRLKKHVSNHWIKRVSPTYQHISVLDRMPLIKYTDPLVSSTR